MSAFNIDLRVSRGDRDASFRLDATFRSDGGTTVVYGPSGSGKSTLLLAILGAVRPESGRIVAGGEIVFDADAGVDLPIRRRQVGLVFQDSSLFPHMDALHNVAFAIRRADAAARAREWLERVGAAELASRTPRELSGGQRQRVALARSLAAEPRALLLDEPFSQLDPPSREALGRLLTGLQNESGIPFLHVTHDLGEALRLGDRIVLLDRGRVLQQGSPLDVVTRPASLDAARAVGTENVFRGSVERRDPSSGCSEIDIGGTHVLVGLIDRAPGSAVVIGLRAEEILLSREPVPGTSARNHLRGTVRELRRRGSTVEVEVDTPAPMRVLITPAALEELELREGGPVHLLIKATAFHLLD